MREKLWALTATMLIACAVLAAVVLAGPERNPLFLVLTVILTGGILILARLIATSIKSSLPSIKKPPMRRLLIWFVPAWLLVVASYCVFAFIEVAVIGIPVVLAAFVLGWLVLASAMGAWLGYKYLLH